MTRLALALALTFAFLGVGCGCYENESGVAVSPYAFEVERQAACQAISEIADEPCDMVFLREVRIYEAPLEDIPDLCGEDDPNTRGCFCRGIGCASIIVPDASVSDRRSTVIHELVHASFASIGRSTADHSADDFWPAWRRAAELVQE